MAEMEDKLNAILGDPQMMQQIMSMAQSFGSKDSAAPPSRQEVLPGMDPGMLQKMASLASQSSIDQREQALLGALAAYLSRDRITRLEKAMRAARLAKVASVALGAKSAL